VNGRTQHVHGYLRDFLFPTERANSPVKALSGGERNRLLLARLLTRPMNVLVLDEPTNDLDIETLELLESYLVDWPGTLLLVSHDRAFVDHVVTSTLVFEGDGRVQEYVGGYEDWLRQRAAAAVPAKSQTSVLPAGRSGGSATAGRKLSFKEQREMEELPRRIEQMEGEQEALHATIASREFYKEAPDAIARVLARIDELKDSLHDAYARWDELDSRAKPL
jgi:ABC transport system ATP-binding/permease protein